MNYQVPSLRELPTASIIMSIAQHDWLTDGNQVYVDGHLFKLSAVAAELARRIDEAKPD